MRKFFVTLIAILLMCTACNNNIPSNVIDEFNYADIKENSVMHLSDQSEYKSIYIHSSLAEIEASNRKNGIDDEGNLIHPEYPLSSYALYNYGIIAIIKVKSSENMLVAAPDASSSYFGEYNVLSANQIYDQYDTIQDIRMVSYVKTTVEVVDVLYQTEKTNFRVGDTFRLREPYYIVDQRVPKILSSIGGGEYQVCSKSSFSWNPLEAGETYLVWGAYNVVGKEFEVYNHQVTPFPRGIYCLSDKTKQAGYDKTDELMQESFAYIQEHYPDVYNTYLAQAQ